MKPLFYIISLFPKTLFVYLVDLCLSTKLYKLFKTYKVTKVNIEIAYPDLNRNDVEQLSKLSIRESIISGFETIFTWGRNDIYSNSKIFSKHIIRNSFGPFATRIGLGLPFTIASLVIVESTTNWNGMGSLLYQTILNQDSNAAMGLFLLLALLTIILRITISLIQMIIDPRVRAK